MCIRDRRSSGWFGTAPRREVPEGLPPSPVQHRVQKLYLHQAPSSCGTHEPVGMLTWETTVEAQALYARGWTKSAIARHLGTNRRTVREYLKGQRVRSEPEVFAPFAEYARRRLDPAPACLLYTSDAADEEDSVDLGGRRII